MSVLDLIWQLRVATNGELANAKQNSDADVQSCIEAILAYPRQWRVDNMAFGRPDDIIFTQGGADIAAIATAISDLEPRATPRLVARAIEAGQQTVSVKTEAARAR